MRGDMKRREYNATNANCTMVRVTGYRNCTRIALPVLEDKAEEEYHTLQRRTKSVVD
jgi:hypothetical protein